MENKDIEYYRSNPDELPEDQDMLNQLYDEAEASEGLGEEQSDLEEQAEEKETTEEESASKADEEDKQAADGTNENSELMAKDGKNKIPYSVLEKTRADLVESQRASEESDRRIREMQEEIDRLNVAKEEPEEKAPSAVDELSDEYGDDVIAKAAREQDARTNSLEDRTEKAEADLARLKEEREEKMRETYREEANAAVDANPTLTVWRDDPDQWESVLAVNKMLMEKDEWKSKSLDELSAEIVRRLGGPIEAEKEKIEIDTSTKTTPKSLSDIPAGSSPTQTLSEEVSRLSDAEFSVRYNNCRTDDERNALMSSVGM